MQLIDRIFTQIEAHPHSGSSEFLAKALAAACSRHYSISLLDASVKLDMSNRALLSQLIEITHEGDFSNADQEAALHKLREFGFIE